MANPKGNPQNLIPFRPGQSGNPGGKPVNARNRLTNGFLNALADDFDRHGVAAIEACRQQSPGRYLAIIASLLPKELMLDQGRAFSDWSDEELMAVTEQLRGHVGAHQEAEQLGSRAVSGPAVVEAVDTGDE
jgi:hypothetical protein